ncbi:PadR family transcriptional regulator, partial [Bordetella holmesii]|nr:PadR family transcriptional regulator [Bordetella holmesii]
RWQTGPQGVELATGWVPECGEARLALRESLLLKRGASPAVQRRVAAILRGTAQEIDLPPCSR